MFIDNILCVVNEYMGSLEDKSPLRLNLGSTSTFTKAHANELACLLSHEAYKKSISKLDTSPFELNCNAYIEKHHKGQITDPDNQLWHGGKQDDI